MRSQSSGLRTARSTRPISKVSWWPRKTKSEEDDYSHQPHLTTDTLSKPTSASSISAIIHETIERRKRNHLEAKLSSYSCLSVEDVQLTRGRARMSLSVLRSDPATFKNRLLPENDEVKKTTTTNA